MLTIASRKKRRSRKNGRGQPPWQVALLFPRQGEWTERDFLELEGQSENRMLELVNGFLEVLPMPNLVHQSIVKFLFCLLNAHVTSKRLGEVHFAPLPIRLWENLIRELDLVFLRKHRIKNRRKPPEGADLAMEVISPGEENRERDAINKRRDYAKARIPEYWIVDPEEQLITVLVLGTKSYKVHGKFKLGERATSKLLSGFSV
ncbi:MAG: Uma2 family endonuclease, partial [Gemmataceae bacterium]|nr:Uma2 family endonuclease [Gemmataceae bacterium]